MAINVVDLIKVKVLSIGTGALSLGEAVPGYRGIEGLTNGLEYSYSIQQDSADYEIGKGTYLSSGNQLIRSPLHSSNGDAALDLRPNATVAFVLLSSDLDKIKQGEPGPKGDPGAAGNVAATLAQLKSADIANDTMLYDSAAFKWSLGDYTGQADDTDIVESDNVGISVGAWVRQSAANIQDAVRASLLASTDGGGMLGIEDGGRAQDALSAGRPVATVADMKLLSPSIGAVYKTAGYYSPGDGGAATYKVEVPTTVDGLGDHEFANGNIARLQRDAANPIQQWGAKGDGTADDTPSFLAAAANAMLYGSAVRWINLGDNDDAVFVINDTIAFDLVGLIWGGRGTVKRADGTIVNTDGDSDHFIPMIRVGGAPFAEFYGTWKVDGNRDGQTYPDTDSTPGRGSNPFRHNGDIEICPGSDNTTPSTNIRGRFGGCVNSYLNGLVLWQVQGVDLTADSFDDGTWNGIAGAGCRDVRISNTNFDRSGYSSVFGIDRKLGDRAGVQFREFPIGFTSATEGLPTIEIADGDINERIVLFGCTGLECCVESFYMRACFASAMVSCRSKDCGYGALDAVMTYYPAHFWAEGGEVVMTDCHAVQTKNEAGDRKPDFFRNVPLDGDASTDYPAIGSQIVTCPGCSGKSVRDASGNPQALANRGVYCGSKVGFPGVVIDGTSDYGIVVYNAYSYADEPVPHDVNFNGAAITNVNMVLTSQTAAMTVAKFGSASTGNVKNISAVGLNTDQANAVLVNSNLNSFTKVNVSHGIGTVFSRYYDSGELSLTAGKYQVSHGLGALPRAVTTLIRNKTTELAIPVGDEVHNICPPNVTVDASSSQLTIMVGTGDIQIGNRTTGHEGEPIAITRANWKLVVRALI